MLTTLSQRIRFNRLHQLAEAVRLNDTETCSWLVHRVDWTYAWEYQAYVVREILVAIPSWVDITGEDPSSRASSGLSPEVGSGGVPSNRILR